MKYTNSQSAEKALKITTLLTLKVQGEETKTAALVINGICRAYYVDG